MERRTLIKAMGAVPFLGLLPSLAQAEDKEWLFTCNTSESGPINILVHDEQGEVLIFPVVSLPLSDDLTVHCWELDRKMGEMMANSELFIVLFNTTGMRGAIGKYDGIVVRTPNIMDPYLTPMNKLRLPLRPYERNRLNGY